MAKQKIMNSNDKIKDLKRQIEAEEQKIANCRHEWGKSFYNPEKTSEPYGSVFRSQGSDAWTEPEGMKDVYVTRWTRVCTKCGHENHTKKEKITTKSEGGDFD